jgi:cytochrome c551/c552
MIRSRVKGLAAAATISMAALSAGFLICDGQAVPGGVAVHGKDGAPVVKITDPANGATYPWNSLVSYSVVVTYQGKSTQYQEIPSDEVLLRATSVPDVTAVEARGAGVPTPAGLVEIVRLKCVGCHEFQAKAMGPSFAAIAARYPDNQASIDTLSRSIRNGSTGVWGPGSMPPHTDLTEEQLHAMALWMVKDAGNPGVKYYVGTDGAIRMEAPARPGAHGGVILTASYTAPVPAGDQEPGPRGEDTVILRGK